MITDIEEYFVNGCGRCERFATAECSTRRWHEGLTELRKVCLAAGLTETVKWGQPCYMHSNRNIVIYGAHQYEFHLGFFDAALMKDPDGILEKQGPNTRHAGTIRFKENSRVAELEPLITKYIVEAMGYAEAGIRPPKEEYEVDMPDELAEALEADAELAEAFYKLTPGRQKSYLINLNSAKKSQTRINRIAKFRDKIIAGKGAMEY